MVMVLPVSLLTTMSSKISFSGSPICINSKGASDIKCFGCDQKTCICTTTMHDIGRLLTKARITMQKHICKYARLLIIHEASI